MLVEISVANYRSFRERVTLSLEAEPRLSERDKSVDEKNVAHTEHGDLLRVVGIYGANASGKSNMVRALDTLRWCVLNTARGQSGDPVPADPFRLDDVSEAEPTEIEVVYVEPGRQVRYGVALTRERISHEWLYVRPVGEAEVRWFERRFDAASGNDVYEVGGEWFRVEAFERATRKEALHLSIAGQFSHPQAMQLLSWWQRLVVHDPERWSRYPAHDFLDDPSRAAAIRRLIARLDFGVEDVQVLHPEVSESAAHTQRTSALNDRHFQLLMAHKRAVATSFVILRQGKLFEIHDESAGTVRAITLAGPIVDALASGHVLVIDELDARLHTLLARQIVDLFQDPATNPHNAQLIFTSHDTNLLTRTLLRRDQLYFVEKSHETGASDLYSLAEIKTGDGKRVRNDARYEEDYLQGRYGAIPFFGGLKGALAEALRPEKG